MKLQNFAQFHKTFSCQHRQHPFGNFFKNEFLFLIRKRKTDFFYNIKRYSKNIQDFFFKFIVVLLGKILFNFLEKNGLSKSAKLCKFI
jgi:hypothetical protein